MSEALQELTEETFTAGTKDGIVLLDFWAPWCGPCKMQTPVLEALAERIGDTAKIAKVNVDENQAAATKFGIASIPTLVLLKDGAEVKQFVGLQDEDTLAAAISAASGE